MPMVAMAPLASKAMCGVWCLGWTRAIGLGKIPSSDQANMSRETDKSMAGKSLVRATAAPATMATVRPEGSR